MKAKTTKFGLKGKMLCMSLIPAVVLGIVLTLFAANSITKGMQKEMLQGLTAVTQNFITMLNQTDTGDYRQDTSGKVYKGKYVITGNDTLEDQIKSSTGYDVTLFYGDTRVVTSIKDPATGKKIVGTKASDQVITAVLKGGNTYTATAVKVNGKDYFGCYIPLKNSDGTIVGMVTTVVPSSDAQKFIMKQIYGLTELALVIFLLVLIVGIAVPTILTKEILKEAEFIRTLAEGNLDTEVDEKLLRKKDELGDMARELSALRNQLCSTVKEIRDSSEILLEQGNSLETTAAQTNLNAEDIGKAVEDIAKGAVTQAEGIEKASKNVETMGEVLEGIVNDVRELDQISSAMKKVTDESGEIIGQPYETNDKTQSEMSRIAKQVRVTNSSVQNISEAVKIISGIAEETNLLSLNASIEAARAGDAGRGFAVVAVQIQKLAEQSNTSAGDIQNIIEELIRESKMSIEVVDSVEKTVQEQQKKLEETREKFSGVTEGVNKSHKMTGLIKGNTDVCNTSRGAVEDVIEDLAAISEENAASSQETNASMEELSATIHLLAEAAVKLKNISENLDQKVRFFKI